MEEVKVRVRAVTAALESNILAEPFRSELVALQLRRVLELIAFGSLSVNKANYAAAYPKFEQHWKAVKMLQALEKIHPAFYPQPHLLESRGPGRFHLALPAPGFLTREQFVELYDATSDSLHTTNPFAVQKSSNAVDNPRQWVARIQRLLDVHLMCIAGKSEVWLIRMEDKTDGRVHAAIAQPLVMS